MASERGKRRLRPTTPYSKGRRRPVSPQDQSPRQSRPAIDSSGPASHRPARRRRGRRPLPYIWLLAFFALILIGCLIYYLTAIPTDTPAVNPLTQVEATSSTEPAVAPTTVVRIAAAGDLNVTDTVVQQNQLPEGGYDFRQAFSDVLPILAQADLAVLNFEGNLCGEPYGSQSGSAPIELATALAQAGVDLVQTANSASIRNGMLGLASTLTNLHSAGLETAGAYATPEQAKSGKGFVIREVNGLRIAFVAFTKGMDNLGLPEGSEGCVNLLYTDYATTYREVDYSGIRQILRSVSEAQPDFTIAMLHWGSEYNEEISSSQKKIRNLLLENGVDVILGTHPHLVQEIEYDQDAGTLVAYSLGDFYGDAEESGSQYALILNLEITRDNYTGITTLTGYSYTPTYILKPEQSAEGGLRVTPIQQTIALYDAGFAGRVPEETYNQMKKALEKIETRIKGPAEE